MLDRTQHEATQLREVRDKAGTRGIEVCFGADVPPDEALFALWDLDNFPRLFPDVREAREVSRGEDTMDVAFRVDAVLKEIRYTLRRELLRAEREIRWHNLTGDLRKVSGAWKIEPGASPSCCRLTYRTFVDVGFFVPTVMIQKLARQKVGEMVTRVRRVLGELCARGLTPSKPDRP